MTRIAAPTRCLVFPSALGWFALVEHDEAVAALSFGHASPRAALAAVGVRQLDESYLDETSSPRVARLQAYAAGARDDFRDVRVVLGDLTPFQHRVVARCRAIGYGRVKSYGALAQEVGQPRAARAVGRVMATNRVPIIIPCHRVLGAGGRLGGYSMGEGVETKRRLLALEGQTAAPGPRPRFSVTA